MLKFFTETGDYYSDLHKMFQESSCHVYAKWKKKNPSSSCSLFLSYVDIGRNGRKNHHPLVSLFLGYVDIKCIDRPKTKSIIFGFKTIQNVKKSQKLILENLTSKSIFSLPYISKRN